jgi:hypothetical protein
MTSVGILKWPQLMKLLRIFGSSLMRTLSIFGAIEVVHFEFINLSCFWKFGKISNWLGPHVSTCFQTTPLQIALPPSDSGRHGCSHRRFATGRHFLLSINRECGREEKLFSHFAISLPSLMLRLDLVTAATLLCLPLCAAALGEDHRASNHPRPQPCARSLRRPELHPQPKHADDCEENCTGVAPSTTEALTGASPIGSSSRQEATAMTSTELWSL